jgi:hypothetical protein
MQSGFVITAGHERATGMPVSHELLVRRFLSGSEVIDYGKRTLKTIRLLHTPLHLRRWQGGCVAMPATSCDAGQRRFDVILWVSVTIEAAASR